jgi:signal transduction histidine kinase
MTPRVGSLSRRLMLAAGGFIAVALIVAAVLIAFVLHRFVQGQIDQRLDAQILFLASTLRADASGLLQLAGSADGPPFDRPRRGWYWQVEGPRNTLRAAALGDATLVPPDRPDRPGPPPPPPKADDPPRVRPAPADGPGPDDGRPLHYRILDVPVQGGTARIVATSPREAVLGPLGEAMRTLALSLAVLGLALIGAMALQVRLGLRPLEQLRRAVAEVRSGRRERLPGTQPREVQPLAEEINALLAENAASLSRARGHVANLAHGLKTPLATLAVALQGETRDASRLRELVEQMDRRIRHHLGRARGAALGGPSRSRTRLAPHVADLALVLGKVHADKAVRFTAAMAEDLAVACEAQDLDEMLGNLLENAFVWCRTAVAVTAQPDGRQVVVAIDDDGPGLTHEQTALALQAGRRLDETAPGYGFGLSITRELAELYAGALDLAPSPEGGLRATLRLPRAAEA